MLVYINLDQACTLTTYEKAKRNMVNFETWTINDGWFSKLIGRKPETIQAFVHDTWNGDIILDGERLTKFLKDEHCYIEDNVMYFYPHVDAHMSNQKTITKYFSTIDELKSWVNEAQTKNTNLVIFNN